MKLGVVSDIHGDLASLEKAYSHLIAMGVDQIVAAGDLVGYGPSPDEVASFLMEHQIPSVRGNHDRWALARGPGKPDEYGGGTPSEETLAYLATLSPTMLVEGAARVGVVAHGSPSSDMEFVSRRTHPPAVLRRYLRELSCDLLVVGHTHQPMWYQSPSGRLVVNSGSIISVPVVDSSRTFAVVDLASLTVSFHGVSTGGRIEVGPWD